MISFEIVRIAMLFFNYLAINNKNTSRLIGIGIQSHKSYKTDNIRVNTPYNEAIYTEHHFFVKAIHKKSILMYFPTVTTHSCRRDVHTDH